MINFFKPKTGNNTDESKSFSKIASLLIYAAKIDENYTEKEEQIIKKTLIDLGAKSSEVESLILNAEIMEQKSNHILDFTKEIKNMDEVNKIKIIDSLWKIIYSDNNPDMYETTLMRKLAGLLYIDSKTMGDRKEKIKKQLAK